jgi:hypothetical protein
MSKNNGNRARFQISRKRRVLRRLRNVVVMAELKEKAIAAAADPRAVSPVAQRDGPALGAKS